jgi:hypothetical protein
MRDIRYAHAGTARGASRTRWRIVDFRFIVGDLLARLRLHERRRTATTGYPPTG